MPRSAALAALLAFAALAAHADATHEIELYRFERASPAGPFAEVATFDVPSGLAGWRVGMIWPCGGAHVVRVVHADTLTVWGEGVCALGAAQFTASTPEPGTYVVSISGASTGRVLFTLFGLVEE